MLTEVLDLTEEDLNEKFANGVSMVTSLALAIHHPTIAAAPHMLINGYMNTSLLCLLLLQLFTLLVVVLRWKRRKKYQKWSPMMTWALSVRLDD